MSLIKTIPSGQEYEEVTGETAERLKKSWFMFTDGIIKIKPQNCNIPKNFLHFSKRFYDFNWGPTDILIATFPKSGTTWTQEIIWNLTNNPDLDNELANQSLDARFPNFEADMFLATTGAEQPDPEGDPMKLFNYLCPGKDFRDGILLQIAYNSPPPRMLKAHMPLNYLPPDITKKSKVFYVLRDPRDVIYSMYHYCRLQMMWGYNGNLDDFLDQFIADEVAYCPYWEHVRIAWEKSNDPNFCIVYYEDLKNDIFKEVQRIDKFLGTNRTEKQIQNIVDFTTFDKLKERSKKNPPTSNDGRYFNKEVLEKEGGFFRKGKSGDWKNHFNDEQVEKINKWMKKNLEKFPDDFKYKNITK